jgi:hypothetical protein
MQTCAHSSHIIRSRQITPVLSSLLLLLMLFLYIQKAIKCKQTLSTKRSVVDNPSFVSCKNEKKNIGESELSLKRLNTVIIIIVIIIDRHIYTHVLRCLSNINENDDWSSSSLSSLDTIWCTISSCMSSMRM